MLANVLKGPIAPLVVALAAATVLVAPSASRAGAPLSHPKTGEPAPEFVAMGADGQRHSLSDYRGSTVVLEWTSPVCPYVGQKYSAAVMQTLQRHARGEKAVWLSINTAASTKPGFLTPAAAKARVAATKAVVTAFLFDPDGHIGRSYGARTTPGMYVIDAQGRLAYEGALDDNPENNHTKVRQYVREAIDDLAAKRPVKLAETIPYGCAVEY